VEFRAAARDDVDAVVDLVESAYRGETSRAGWTSEADLLDGQRTDAEEVLASLPDLVLAVQDDELVGCCALVPKGDHAYFGMFAVRPGLQGGGIGAQLIAEAERRAAAQGLSYVEMTVLDVRTELIAFYLRRGYVDTGETQPFPYGDERFGRPRSDDLRFTVLRKTLQPDP
jgi:ribosomal protein S18 acetylase RimI-like enzyme